MECSLFITVVILMLRYAIQITAYLFIYFFITSKINVADNDSIYDVTKNNSKDVLFWFFNIIFFY